MITQSKKQIRPPTLAESVVVLFAFVVIIGVGYMGFRLKIEVIGLCACCYIIRSGNNGNSQLSWPCAAATAGSRWKGLSAKRYSRRHQPS